MREDILDDIHHYGEANHELTPEVIRKVNFLKIEANDRLNRLKQGRIVLWFALGWMLLGTIISWSMNYESPEILWGIIIESALSIGVLVGCIIWSSKKPLWAFSTILVYFLLIWTLYALMDISTLTEGILFKLFFVAVLVRSIMAVRDVNRYSNKLEKLGAPVAEVDKLRDYQPVELTQHSSNG